MTAVVHNIFPSPVKGESTPPKRNPKNPNTADALPELRRCNSNARAVDEGKISPRKNNNPQSAASTVQTEPAINITATTHPINKNPDTPALNAETAVLNFVTVRLPAIIANALTPKQRLY